MVVPFDETTLALTGDAVAVVEGLRVGFAGTMDLAVSATGTLFYTTGSVVGGLAEVVWVTRDGTAEEIDPGWTEDFGFPKLSPDGMQLAVSIRANDEEQIWIKELDRGPPRKLTFAGTHNDRPAWTPNGTSVAFVSNRGPSRDLYVRRADGSGQADLLLDEDRVIDEVTYSPYGEWLVYRVGRLDGERDLWEVTYSPNGEWLIYRANETTVLGGLYALRLGVDSVPVPLVATEFSETAPAVSPDGRWLAYASNE